MKASCRYFVKSLFRAAFYDELEYPDPVHDILPKSPGRNKEMMKGGNTMEKPSYNGFMEAVVVDATDPLGEGRVAVVIPRLNPSNDPKSKGVKPKVQSNKSSIYANETPPAMPATVKTTNGFWLRPVWGHLKGDSGDGGQYMPPTVGSGVVAFFLDADPQKGYYMPSRLTRAGDVAPGKNLAGEYASAYGDKARKPKVHIIHEFPNGMVIGAHFDGSGEIFLVVNPDSKIEIEDKQITATASEKFLVKSKVVDLGGGAHEHLVLGDSFKSLYVAHIHPTGVGPSGPPVAPMLDHIHLSTYNVTL
jgi:hypothetical protein